jgi:hypothetical protein
MLSGQEITRETVASEVQEHFLNPKPSFAFTEEIPGEDALTRQVNYFFKDNFLYIDYLSRESTEYKEALVDSVCAFLESRGWEIPNLALKPKTRLAIEDLKITAVRHICPFRVSAEGKISTLICASALGFKDFSERQIEVEAFAFQSIFKDIKKDESYVLTRVRELANLAKKMKFSTNPEDLIKRAQGMFWILFYSDQEFEKLLLKDYEAMAKFLPFEVVYKEPS